MPEVLDFILEVGPIVIAVASAVAAVTNTPKDDEAVSKAYKVLDALALNVGKAKQTGEKK